MADILFGDITDTLTNHQVDRCDLPASEEDSVVPFAGDDGQSGVAARQP
jgi:hypothetical protein